MSEIREGIHIGAQYVRMGTIRERYNFFLTIVGVEAALKVLLNKDRVLYALDRTEQAMISPLGILCLSLCRKYYRGQKTHQSSN